MLPQLHTKLGNEQFESIIVPQVANTPIRLVEAGSVHSRKVSHSRAAEEASQHAGCHGHCKGVRQPKEEGG